MIQVEAAYSCSHGARDGHVDASGLGQRRFGAGLHHQYRAADVFGEAQRSAAAGLRDFCDSFDSLRILGMEPV